MSSQIEIAGIKISQLDQLDWDATPESVKAVVTVLSERLAYIEERRFVVPEDFDDPLPADILKAFEGQD